MGSTKGTVARPKQKKDKRIGEKKVRADHLAPLLEGMPRRTRARVIHAAVKGGAIQEPDDPNLPPPKGKPKGTLNLVNIMKRVLLEQHDDKTTKAEHMIKQAYKFSVEGVDFRYYKEFLERIEGKVPDKLITDVARTAVSEQINAVAGAIIDEAANVAEKYIAKDKYLEFVKELNERIGAIACKHGASQDEEPQA